MRGTRPERALEQVVEHEDVLRTGDRILIACSGGCDSVGLAALLAGLAQKRHWQLVIGHVNHGTRDSAWQDEAVALRAGAALDVPVKVAALAPSRRDEASLREARYAALADLAEGCGANVIATAHNAEDQSETVLLALFRGAGPAGLMGMPARRPLKEGPDLARPLLRVERARIRAYVEAAALPYAIDPTNADIELRRNAVRQALGALRPLFPGLDEAVSRAAELIAAEAAGAPRAALRRHVRDTLESHEALRDVDFQHVEAAVRALQRGRSGRFHMGRGLELAIEDGVLTVHRKQR
ncbi:MAG TPA: tRNA lysidine(34) synthetase TilS [Candidatus Baltobacteraceae bacterium]|jgi:tRNA(Ile)-lysidine synthase|nr:tRNA lysidine(34) synthetase TilS [Candidatus Baltobacteraceae bacterium]